MRSTRWSASTSAPACCTASPSSRCRPCRPNPRGANSPPRPAIARRCLHQRIPTQQELAAHVAACVAERNATRATVKWQFTLEKARGKLDRHYQKIRATNLPD
jgi:hypothetical protein